MRKKSDEQNGMGQNGQEWNCKACRGNELLNQQQFRNNYFITFSWTSQLYIPKQINQLKFIDSFLFFYCPFVVLMLVDVNNIVIPSTNMFLANDMSTLTNERKTTEMRE